MDAFSSYIGQHAALVRGGGYAALAVCGVAGGRIIMRGLKLIEAQYERGRRSVRHGVAIVSATILAAVLLASL